MLGPQWGVTSTASASTFLTTWRSHSGTSCHRSAKATPGRCGAAAKSAGWSVTPTTPNRKLPAASTAGRRAAVTSPPAPTVVIPAP